MLKASFLFLKRLVLHSKLGSSNANFRWPSGPKEHETEKSKKLIADQPKKIAASEAFIGLKMESKTGL